MTIIISSQGNTLQSQPSLRFGRTPIFIKYDLEDNAWEALDNPGVSQSGGAGVSASQFLIDQNASTALSGRFGPNAHRVLKAADIRMVTFDETYPTVLSVIDAFKANQLNEDQSPQ